MEGAVVGDFSSLKPGVYSSKGELFWISLFEVFKAVQMDF